VTRPVDWPRPRGAGQSPIVALCAYVVAVAALIAIGATSLAAAFDDFTALSESWRRQEALAARPATIVRDDGGASRRGPLLLQARTVGVAAADLQQRVEAAARGVGARTLSSRVDPQDASTGNGALAYVGEIELAAASLQPLLYDLEAGAPLVEVADLSIRPLPDATGGERLRISLAVTAEWRPQP